MGIMATDPNPNLNTYIKQNYLLSLTANKNLLFLSANKELLLLRSSSFSFPDGSPSCIFLSNCTFGTLTWCLNHLFRSLTFMLRQFFRSSSQMWQFPFLYYAFCYCKKAASTYKLNSRAEILQRCLSPSCLLSTMAVRFLFLFSSVFILEGGS